MASATCYMCMLCTHGCEPVTHCHACLLHELLESELGLREALFSVEPASQLPLPFLRQGLAVLQLASQSPSWCRDYQHGCYHSSWLIVNVGFRVSTCLWGNTLRLYHFPSPQVYFEGNNQTNQKCFFYKKKKKRFIFSCVRVCVWVCVCVAAQRPKKNTGSPGSGTPGA